MVLPSSMTARNKGLGAFEVGDIVVCRAGTAPTGLNDNILTVVGADGVVCDRAAPDLYHEPPAVEDREAITPPPGAQLFRRFRG